MKLTDLSATAALPRQSHRPLSERQRELQMLQSDLAAFQGEELDAIGACLTTLLSRASRPECLRAYHAHEAARARTRECLRRLQAW